MFDLKDLKALKEAKKQVEHRDEDTDHKYNVLYTEALDALQVFVKAADYDRENLKKAADKLAAALEIKKNRAEPYFYLAYIFYLLGNLHLALDYLKVATFLNPNLKGINSLKEEIDVAGRIHHEENKAEPEQLNNEPVSETIAPPANIIPKTNLTIGINRVRRL